MIGVPILGLPAKFMLQSNSRSIPELISNVRQRHPRSIALSQGQLQSTYEELDDKANRFASHLARLGVGPDCCVALCFERCFDWIIAALGVLRAGAAYVPLDPGWPDSRLRFAVEDSGANILIARATLLDRLQCRALGLDPFRDAAAIASAPALEHKPIPPDGPAYIIYTSGSTGVPKGVEITHACLSNLIRWHSETFEVKQSDRASHVLSLGFDAAVLEIWGHLSAGATLCLPIDDAIRSSPELLQQWILRERVTIALVPAIVGSRLITMNWPAQTALRLLVVGGDALHHGPAAHLPFKVINQYGPTECTVVSTFAELTPGNMEAPPIGRPIAGASIYLLDHNRRAVSDGTVGEIYVGGRVVGRGYRNRTDLTKRSFLHDPFARILGARMYRTGDRGIRREDGQIEFCGRLDRQVKLRGQRVELDEIAAVLNRYPKIEFATTIASTSHDGEPQLIAYVLPKDNVQSFTKQELQTHLLDHLPAYMVPSIFVQLRDLPLTTNGKLDLTALPPPESADLLDGISDATRVSAIEKKLLALVRELLGVDSIAAGESFFLAGGHSLLGMQLILRVREIFGVEITLRQLIEAPSAAALSVLIDRAVSNLVLSQANNGRVFWVQSRAVDFAKFFRDEQPLFCAALNAHDFKALGHRPTIPAIAAALLRKIRQAQPTGPYRISGFCLGGIVAYEMACQLRAAGEKVSLLALVDAPDPGSLAPHDTWDHKMVYLRYVATRAKRLGFRRTTRYFSEHVFKRFFETIRFGKKSAHQLTEFAAHNYHPPKYDGDVLLLLASERPAYIDLAAGWRALVTGKLDIHYVRAYHRELLRSQNARYVARTILSHIAHKPASVPVPCSIDRTTFRYDSDAR